MIAVERNGLHIIQSELLLDAGLPHGWFGVSLGNMQFRPGNPYNDPEFVPAAMLAEKRSRACSVLGIHAAQLVLAKGLLQTDIVQELGPEHAGTTAGPADGYVTATANMPVALNAADCLQTIIYEPQARVLGVIHSGGQGTARGVLPNAVRMMQERFNARPATMLVGIGPALRGAHYVPTRAVDGYTLADIAATHPVTVELPDGRVGYEVVDTAVAQLRQAGIAASHIEVSQTDTFDSPEFYSWERDRQTDPAAAMRRHMLLAALPAVR